MEIKRLFDYIYRQNEQFPVEDCLGGKENGKWIKFSTQQVIDLANNVSLSLLELGVKPGDNVGIVSNNRWEWVVMDLGIQQIGAVNTPIYPTISEEEYTYILNHADIGFMFVSDADLFQKITNIKSDVPSLKDIYSFNKVSGAKHFDEFLALGKGEDLAPVKEIMDTIKEDDLATIIYTSGTTGTPKGVMMSHKNIVSNVEASLPLMPLKAGMMALSFLPLNHVFEKNLIYQYMGMGVRTYFAESLETIGDNLKELKPHFFTCVPRLLEKVFEKIMAKGEEQVGIKKKLFFWAVDLGMKYDIRDEKNGFFYKMKLAIANKLIFSKWREALGGNIVGLVSGSAPLQPRLIRIFNAGQIEVIEGYGLTETAPVVTTNRFDRSGRMLGTVGPLLPGVEAQIAEDGEILIKGPNVMMGYYKNEEATKEVIDENGWFHTGDIGTFVDGKYLKITDRKKQMFKTSGGKYVAPQPIENKFKESNLIEQIMIVGEYKKFVSALIVPNLENLKKWCQSENIGYVSDMDILANPKVKAKYDSIRDEFNQCFSHVEQVKRYALLADEWTVETKELTPTMKVKRKVVLEKYGHIIDEIYNC